MIATGHFYYSAGPRPARRTCPGSRRIQPRQRAAAVSTVARRAPPAPRERSSRTASRQSSFGLPYYAGSVRGLPRHDPRRPPGARAAGRRRTGFYIDAIWDKPRAHRRPFAGHAERGFALGTARIARLAQVPVVLGIAAWTDDSTVRVVWRPPIEPPRIDDERADVRVHRRAHRPTSKSSSAVSRCSTCIRSGRTDDGIPRLGAGNRRRQRFHTANCSSCPGDLSLCHARARSPYNALSTTNAAIRSSTRAAETRRWCKPGQRRRTRRRAAPVRP